MTFDAYFLRARVAPAAIMFSPFAALLGAVGISPLGAGGLAVGATAAWSFVAAGFVGDRGRELQQALFARWGGSPTTQRLRFASGDPAVGWRHTALSSIAGIVLPNLAEEQRDSEVADRTYDRAVEIARASLREAERHRILADTNAEFGFRRNCLAVRQLGLAAALVAAAVGLLLWTLAVGPRPSSYLVASLISGVAAAFWWWISEAWVRSAAERYADQFFQTLHTYSVRTQDDASGL